MRKINTEIPKGIYCYDENGLCPHWERREDQPDQMNGYCHYLKRGDWEVEIPDDFPPHFPHSCLSLLWDQVKECFINMDEEND
jgi:hypothetical protein